MLKRLTDRISAAVRGDANPNVQALTSMGFSAEAATTALEQSNHDVDRAVELLLAQQQQLQQHPQQQNYGHYNQEDESLQRALEESRRMEEERQQQQQQQQQQRFPATRTRTAAMNRAAEAALQRAENNQKKMTVKKAPVTKTNATSTNHSNTTTRVGAAALPATGGATVTATTLTAHHPGVKLIPKLTDKSKEEQVLRCADRVKSYPLAVDTLYKALMAIQNHPENETFRRIDKTTAGYQRSIASAPGAESFLLAMNFHPLYSNNTNQYLVMEYPLYDPALLYLGISALEQTKVTTEYKMEKQKMEFIKEMKQIRASTVALASDETAKRAAFLQKCPAEPAIGRGALIQIKLYDNETIRRRFDGDDTLADVLHWIGSHGSIIYHKIVHTREWSLIDKNRYPVLPIDCSIPTTTTTPQQEQIRSNNNHNKTLQSIGCWPSGLLEIVPSTEEFKNGIVTTTDKPGSYRGLGAPPREDAM